MLIFYTLNVMKINVKPELLTWARERASLAEDTLAQRLAVTTDQLAEWESTGQLTFKQLESLAKATYTPFGYLFLSEPPAEQLPIPDFRTVNDSGVARPSPNLLDTIYAMQRRQDWMRQTLESNGAQQLGFVGSTSRNESPYAVAALIRATLNLDAGWADQLRTWADALRTLRDAVESSGVLVVVNGVVGNNTYRKLDVQELRGFVLIDQYAPLIFVNGSDAKAAQMFTLAHELAHVWTGQAGVFSLESLQPTNHANEAFCNNVAAEFLIPATDMAESWTEATTVDEPYQFLARRYKVSPLVAARRALDLNLITRPEFLAFYEAYAEDERRRKPKGGGGDFFATQGVRIGKRFGEAVVRAVKEGRLMYGEAYHLTGLRGTTFDKYAEKIGYNMQ